MLRKCILVKPDIHTRLASLGKKDESFNSIISRLLDNAGNLGGKS